VSVVAFIERCLEAGMPLEMAMKAAKAFEETAPALVPAKSARQERNARHYDKRKRLKASESVLNTSEASEPSEPSETVAPSLLPPNPQPPTPTRESISTRPRVARASGFDEFWLAYPRKTGKGEAQKAYAKALTKIDGPDPPTVLLRALERVKATWTDAQFIPHPATWLNQERWNDEPETLAPVIRNDRPLRARTERITSIAGLIEHRRAGCGGDIFD
jgi:hypothetical protein